MFFFLNMQILTDISSIPSTKFSPPISIGMLSSTLIGPLWIALSNLGIVALDWSMPQDEFTQQVHDRFNANVIYDDVLTADPLRQLSEYLSGRRREFDLVLHLTRMTEFQVKVLKLTLDIPYGQTATYKEIADRSWQSSFSARGRSYGSLKPDSIAYSLSSGHRFRWEFTWLWWTRRN